MSGWAKVFVITGPSGVGKGTLIRTLLERMPELELAVSATTRSPRPGEPGVDYHFLEEPEFDRRVIEGDFVEHAEYSGRRYGTLRSELEKRIAEGHSVVLEIEVQGARQIAQTMPDAVRIFIAPPSEETLRLRLVGRGTDDAEQIESRLRVAKAELAAQHEFAHVVHNDRLDEAVEELREIVASRLSGPVSVRAAREQSNGHGLNRNSYSSWRSCLRGPGRRRRAERLAGAARDPAKQPRAHGDAHGAAAARSDGPVDAGDAFVGIAVDHVALDRERLADRDLEAALATQGREADGLGRVGDDARARWCVVAPAHGRVERGVLQPGEASEPQPAGGVEPDVPGRDRRPLRRERSVRARARERALAAANQRCRRAPPRRPACRTSPCS